MRLLSVKHFLKENIPKLVLNTDTSKDSANREYTIVKNWVEIYAILEQSMQCNFLRELVNPIFSMGVGYQSHANLKVLTGEYNKFLTRFNVYLSSLNTCYALLNEFISDDDNNQINIKFPDNCSIGEYEGFFSELDFIFNKCPLINNLNDKNPVIIKKVDSGSIIIVLGIASAAVTIIAGVAKLALYVRRELINQKQLEQTVKSAKIHNDAQEQILKQLKNQVNLYCNEQAKQLTEQYDITATAEEINSLAKSIEKTANLMNKGLEFHASFAASVETQNLFPSNEENNQLLSYAKQMLLAESNSI